MTQIDANWLKEKAIGAMTASAYGDALGWPNERRSGSPKSGSDRKDPHVPIEWIRRAGGRFYSHEEIIKAGEYSDDTQLILCTARSLLYGEKWFAHLTEIELPFWLEYERGGGRATKVAAKLWSGGKRPWGDECPLGDRKKYFMAGGNGVAMRILPHVICLYSESDFHAIGRRILLDGITTHGHPRALLGALAYGFALWTAFNVGEHLDYALLVKESVENRIAWASQSFIEDIPPEWKSMATEVHGDFPALWEKTADEVLAYLRTAMRFLDKGALCEDRAAMTAMDAFDKKVNGAGTVSATIACFLASKYAADPINGIIRAAYANGSDTDTNASMVGALLGAIAGKSWLSSVKGKIQDHLYIEQITTSLLLPNGDKKEACIRKPAKDAIGLLQESVEGEDLKLPDGRDGHVDQHDTLHGKNGRFEVHIRTIKACDGQTLFVKKISKTDVVALNRGVPRQEQTSLPFSPSVFGPKLIVQNMDDSVWFYGDVIGLSIRRENKDFVSFHQGLVLVEKGYFDQFGARGLCSFLYVEVSDIDKCYAMIRKRGLDILTPIQKWKGGERRFFRCRDMDKNILEVFEIRNE